MVFGSILFLMFFDFIFHHQQKTKRGDGKVASDKYS